MCLRFGQPTHGLQEAMEALRIIKFGQRGRDPPLRYTQLSTPMGRSYLALADLKGLQNTTSIFIYR